VRLVIVRHSEAVVNYPAGMSGINVKITAIHQSKCIAIIRSIGGASGFTSGSLWATNLRNAKSSRKL
jgi:hypothetical protein